MISHWEALGLVTASVDHGYSCLGGMVVGVAKNMDQSVPSKNSQQDFKDRDFGTDLAQVQKLEVIQSNE